MNSLKNSFKKVLRENEDNELYYEKFKAAHDNLISDLKTFRESLEPSILVPVCNRVFMRGKLIHTNEVMVSLGCGYFTKCTSSEAQQICLRRIQKVDSILQSLDKERNFVQSQMKFSEDHVFSSGLQEIVEPYDDNVEEEWRKQHAINLKEYRKKENHIMVSHEEIMSKLELLELQEEIEELHNDQNATGAKKSVQIVQKKAEVAYETIKEKECETEKSREFVLRKKLADLRQRKKNKITTEDDIFQRLNELEEEEEIEDELDRLYDEMYGGQRQKESTESEKSSNESSGDEYDLDKASEGNQAPQLEDLENSVTKSRRVSFATQVDPDVSTVTIHFSHSDNEIQQQTSSSTINSPSDIYKSFPENFKKETKSIIKNCHRVKEEARNTELSSDSDDNEVLQPRRHVSKQHVIIGNVVEHLQNKDQIANTNDRAEQTRPISKFKSMRSANKSSK